MQPWQRQLQVDPVPTLLASGDEALQYLVRRDLLGEKVEPVCCLWQLPKARRIWKKQQPDGSWIHPGEKKHQAINYSLIETWKQFRFLVEMYGANLEDPATQRAAEFLFSCQTKEGDIRGFLANQYAPYYTGAIMALLIKAGYEDDPRIESGFQWLLSMRQDDGGWSVPLITHVLDRETMYRLTSQHAEPLEPDRSRPFSHNWTGMVLRAFAAHSRYRRSEAARTAADLLKSRFFQPDCYTSYQAASYWLKFQYPFWWNNLVTALDSVSLIDPSHDEAMDKALDWLIDHQQPSGLWRTRYDVTTDERWYAESCANCRGGSRTAPTTAEFTQRSASCHENARARETSLWVTLAICRVFSRMCPTGTSEMPMRIKCRQDV